jgi:hypothetical protein
MTNLASKVRSSRQPACDAGAGAVDFESRLGFVAVMSEFPRPVLLAHRFLYAAIILFMARDFWRTFLQPVTMLSDFPATVLALIVTLAGFVFCWLKGRVLWLLLLCDGLLISIAALYFWGR